MDLYHVFLESVKQVVGAKRNQHADNFSPCTMDESPPSQMHLVLHCCRYVWTSHSKLERLQEEADGCNIVLPLAFFTPRSAKQLGAVL